MTLRYEALSGMLDLETAAAQWFAKMSPRERQAYIKSHPRSKYAKNTGGVLAQQATTLSTKSGTAGMRHGMRGERFNTRGKTKISAVHHRIAGHHGQAAAHYGEAAEHFAAGRTKEGHASLSKGLAHTNRATTLNAKRKAEAATAKAARMEARTAAKGAPPAKKAKTGAIMKSKALKARPNDKDA